MPPLGNRGMQCGCFCFPATHEGKVLPERKEKTNKTGVFLCRYCLLFTVRKYLRTHRLYLPNNPATTAEKGSGKR